MIRGLVNREIAAILTVSPNTVRNHLVAVFRKMNVSTRAELVFVASSYREEQARRAAMPGWVKYLG